MKILIVEPQKRPYEKDIEHTLETMQGIVNGYIQAIYPFEDEVAIVCDDEAKLKYDTQWNRFLPEIQDVIKGTFFVCGLSTDNFADLSTDLMEKYKKRFWSPEMFIPTLNGLIVIPLK